MIRMFNFIESYLYLLFLSINSFSGACAIWSDVSQTRTIAVSFVEQFYSTLERTFVQSPNTFIFEN